MSIKCLRFRQVSGRLNTDGTLLARARCRDSARRGLTLVEILAGLTLLASLAVATLLAYGAHHHQIRTAQDQLAAAALADQLLVQWYSSERPIPRPATAVLLGTSGWYWRTQLVDRGVMETLPIEVIRVQIIRPATGQFAAKQLISLDLLVPVQLQGPAGGLSQ